MYFIRDDSPENDNPLTTSQDLPPCEGMEGDVTVDDDGNFWRHDGDDWLPGIGLRNGDKMEMTWGLTIS
jgi:hypothetical protein